jgi:hypothetical protein
MQFIFSDPYYDTESWDDSQYLQELETVLAEYDKNLVLHHADIGHGADWPGVLVEIYSSLDWKVVTGTSVASVFLLGEKINKNLDAWLSIGQKVSSLIQKFKPARIDEEAAICWVINELSINETSLKDLEIRLQVVPFSSGPSKSKLKLEAQPDNLYIISARTSTKVYVYGLKSNSKLEFKKEFDTDWCSL